MKIKIVYIFILFYKKNIKIKIYLIKKIDKMKIHLIWLKFLDYNSFLDFKYYSYLKMVY